ncbi:hypothetical protein [Actinomadura miaoliensis]|uniref:Uncharacterized protein n=1 Tax=Actinomadura miaoliensis TaxID=430685 RepID=A0ABP7X008_9ACTN
MPDKLTLPIPTRLTASFVVAAPQQLPEDLTRLATVLHSDDAPHGVDLVPYVDVRSVDVPPMPTLAHLFSCPDCDRTDPALAHRISTSDTYIHVSCCGGASWPPSHVPLAAAVAEAQAIHTGGIPIDADNAVMLAAEYMPYPLTEPSDFHVAGWTIITYTSHSTGLRLQTSGLVRLGLPELRIDEVPQPLAGAWGRVLDGLAQSLLSQQWTAVNLGQASWELDAETTITTADIEAAVGSRHHHSDASVTVRLHQDGSDEPVLTVGPPDGASGAAAQQWHRRIVQRLGLPTDHRT